MITVKTQPMQAEICITRNPTFSWSNEMESNAKNVATRKSVQSVVTAVLTRRSVLAAVKQNGLALKFASAELRSDREIVLAAVKESGGALEFTAPELRGDREIALAARARKAAGR